MKTFKLWWERFFHTCDWEVKFCEAKYQDGQIDKEWDKQVRLRKCKICGAEDARMLNMMEPHYPISVEYLKAKNIWPKEWSK